MKQKSFALLVSLGFVYASTTVDACTTILVGEGATTDGSQFIARTEDHDPTLSKVFLVHNATETKSRIFKATKNNFSYPLPDKSFKYTSFSDGDTHVKNINELTWGAAGFNEVGVGMTATETIFASEKALKNDPYNEDSGITEDSITDVVLPYINSAKEGAERLGKIIEDKGAGEGFGVAFIDAREIWYLETGSGHQWMAQRLPNDKYFVTGNQGRLRKFDKNDSDNYISSKSLIEYAVANKLYNKNIDGDFDFEKAYAEHNTKENGDAYYNYPRVFALQKLFTKNIKINLSEPSKFPVFEKPSSKLDVNSVKNGLRNTYENIGGKPYSAFPETTMRPISLFRTQQSHILQTRKNLPEKIADIEYISYGMPSISIYIPVYVNNINTGDVPEIFRHQTFGKADSVSAQWKFRKLQTLVMLDYYKYAPIVQAEYKKTEQKFSEMQKEAEKKYIKIYKSHPTDADKVIKDFQSKVFSESLSVTDDLTNVIFTDLTKGVNGRYKFSGA